MSPARGPTSPDEEVLDDECCRCGSREDLVPDEHVEGVSICRRCLARVEAQNELIRRGLEEEPDVEL